MSEEERDELARVMKWLGNNVPGIMIFEYIDAQQCEYILSQCEWIQRVYQSSENYHIYNVKQWNVLVLSTLFVEKFEICKLYAHPQKHGDNTRGARSGAVSSGHGHGHGRRLPLVVVL